MIARVSLEIALRREFDYAIPDELAGLVDVGSRVQVPFGARTILGVVTAVAEESAHTKLKPILKIIGGQTLVTEKVLRLARWIGEYYCCAPELALKAVLPEAVRREDSSWRERLFVRLRSGAGVPPKLSKRRQEVLNLIEERREMLLSELVELAGTTAATVRKLEDLGLVEISVQISERDPYAREHILPSQPLTLNPQQSVALEKIKAALQRAVSPVGHPTMLPAELNSPPNSERKPEKTTKPKSLICRQDGPKPDGQSSPLGGGTFLLHGVTGSGKTEIYLQALAHTLEQGKGAIVLVPEISLTPQTVERFKARFSTGKLQTLVAVLHSHLSTGERHDEWHKIRQGRARIVIGARSAIFAPVEPLGLIIVDEEHEHSYKQEESPRYHARDVAIMRGRMEAAVVVLGSATPSLESFYNTTIGKYALLELPERVDDQKMPRVRVVDMRQTSRQDKGPPIFSPQLKEAITQRLERGEQTILFLNRRGYSSSLQCPLCGYVANCPNCSITLTYHRLEQKLACHICGHAEKVPSVCPEPKCKNPAIRFAGTGTQRVEEVLRKLFPKARINRMDADTMKRKEDYRTVLGDFRAGKIDILVGTQMIAKGLHFPNVTLVGIMYADLALYQPDFRAGERTFQLLTQVAGRAGRGDVEGEVFVQAFAPFHPAIQYARRHDFNGFYDQEMEFRAQLKYPPFSRVALITLKGRNEEKVKFVAEHLKEELERQLRGKSGPAVAAIPAATLFDLDQFESSQTPAAPAAAPKHAFKDLVLAGPAPAPLLRAETFYRYQIMLRTRAMTACSRELAVIIQKLTLPEDVTVAVDIDPVNLS